MNLDVPEDLFNHYTIQNGRIRDPGRFEGEPAYTPMFFAFWLDGLADQTDGDTALFWIDDGDVGLFPELAGFSMVALYVTDSGHVSAYPLHHCAERN